MSLPRVGTPGVGELLAGAGTLLAKLLPEVRAAAQRTSTTVWWVGGGVRDLLLGRTGGDLDLLLEGDLGPFVDQLAAQLKGSVRRNERFLTARVELGDGTAIDLASARTESYEAVGALPQVSPASLNLDLGRRDFSINALALRLAPEPCELLDPHDGRADLDAGLLRVLHSRSFRDDPTRILRGVRFETRFGFRFDAATETLAREASKSGVFGTLSSDRLRRELHLTFESWNGIATTLDRLRDLGVMEALVGSDASDAVRPDDPSLRSLGEQAATLPWDRGQMAAPEPWALALRSALETASRQVRADLALRLGGPAGMAARWAEGPVRVAHAVRRLLRTPGPSNHEIEALLHELDSDELSLIAVCGGAAREAVVEFLSQIRGFQLRIGGRDLLTAGLPPGPRIGAALRATREARIDGRVSAEEELTYALRAADGGGKRR